MLEIIEIILLGLAAFCFGVLVYVRDKINRLVPLGLLFWVLVPLIDHIRSY